MPAFLPTALALRPARAVARRWRLFLLFACLLPGGVFAADLPAKPLPKSRPEPQRHSPREAPPPAAVLYLNNGGFVAGALAESNDPEILRWQSPLFAAPFDFRMKHVDSVSFPSPDRLPKPTGAYCFELSGGDLLFGSLVKLNADEAQLDVPQVGRVRVRRDAVRQFFRWKDGAGLVYLGPNGLDEWTLSPTRNAWRRELGQLVTDVSHASLEGKFVLPSRAAIEVEIAWKGKPDFVFAMGTGPDDSSFSQAFHIEAWERNLVIFRETRREADIASLQKINGEVHRIQLAIYLDEDAGRCLVYSSKGKLLADLKIGENARQPQPGLRLTNRRGNLRLERLEVSHWSGALPRGDVGEGKLRIDLSDGTVERRELAGYDAGTKSFLLRGPANARIPAERVDRAVLSQAVDGKPRPFSIAYQDSSRVSGRLLKVEKDSLWLEAPGIHDPLRLPLAGLRSLVVNGGSKELPSALEGARHGTLECEGARLPGSLVDGVRQKNASCLVWMPDGSTNGSPLRPACDGRIVYREPPPVVRQPPPRRSYTIRNNILVRNRPRVVIENEETPETPPPQPSNGPPRKALYLVTGDTIPCEVTRIDLNGLWFTSSLSASTFVPHDKIKAVELTLDGRGPVALTKSKRDRLLTLPRMQKANPPTHLIRSRDGDYLRGRILEMDDHKLLVEVRLKTQEVPRERISRIIWLHPEELAEAAHPPKAPPAASSAASTAGRGAASATRVQALLDDGIRLTFHPEQVSGSTLSGASEALGDCRVKLDTVDQLILGSAIELAATRAAYQQWKLQYAVEPKFMREDKSDAAEGTSGVMESALVGKPAPNFQLDMMAGERFRLADHRGEVVVLDFWATWCSHCLETMPELVRLHAESAGRDVAVVAVNLEETPEQISPMLERRKWQLPVALDRDGAVAAKYGVTAIPQTVIIGRDGTVVRHLIGAGPHLAKNLAEAIAAATAGKQPNTAPKK